MEKRNDLAGRAVKAARRATANVDERMACMICVCVYVTEICQDGNRREREEAR